ncbi:MAG: hypothetical protein JKY37_02350 [Nannocystaceae bacterium]|nr:hypothetical protein [Nannocystaceae bacterium]
MRPALGIGLLLFVAAFVFAAWGLSSIPVSSFAVHVDRQSAVAPDGEVDWRVTVVPQVDSARLTARLDRNTELPLVPDAHGRLTAELRELAPGYHFVEASVHRLGGREDRVVDVIAAGPFQSEHTRGCDVALGLSPQAVRMLLLPALEHKVVEGAKTQEEFFGPTSYVVASELTLVDGGISFTVELSTTAEDKGDLSIDGVVEVSSVGVRGVSLRLRELRRATPGPKLTALAAKEGGKRGTTAGAGGGAVVGALFGGPGGAVVGGILGGLAGNAIGKRLGEREAGQRTESEVYGALVAGLAQATEELRLPSQVSMLPTTPALLGSVQWCEPLKIDATRGMRAALALRIPADEFSDAARVLAVYRGSEVGAIATVASGHNARLEVSEDLVNRLLAEWTVRGGFDEAVADAGLASAIEKELGARTRWRVPDIRVALPPVVRLDDDAIGISLGGVTMRLVDEGRSQSRDVVVGGVGTIELDIRDGGTATISGSLDQAYFGCRVPDLDRRVLPACFSSAVDPELIRKKINLAIMVNAARLPGIDLSGLVQLRSAEATGSPLALQDARVAAAAGVLSLDATLVPLP